MQATHSTLKHFGSKSPNIPYSPFGKGADRSSTALLQSSLGITPVCNAICSFKTLQIDHTPLAQESLVGLSSKSYLLRIITPTLSQEILKIMILTVNQGFLLILTQCQGTLQDHLSSGVGTEGNNVTSRTRALLARVCPTVHKGRQTWRLQPHPTKSPDLKLVP